MSENMSEDRLSKWNLVGPVALAILMYSGQLGASPILRWLPVNATALSAGIVLMSFLLSSISRLPNRWIFLPISLWILFLVPTLPPAVGDYADEKTTVLMTMTATCVLAPFQLLRFHRQRLAFIVTLAMCSLLAGYMTMTSGSAAAIEAQLSNEVLILEGASTISTARLAGTGALIFLVLAMTVEPRRKGPGSRRFWLMAAGLMLVGVMVATGSRGPFAAIAAGLAAIVFCSGALHRRRFRMFLLLSVTAWASYWWATSKGFVSTDRAFAWLAGERDDSTSTRQYLWRIASEHALSNPGGTGWGGFANLPGVSVFHPYPHNLMIEIYTETGWVIGTLVLLFIIVSFWRLMRRSTEPVVAVLFALAVFTFVNAMVSGDINDNRLFWAMMAVAWILPTPATSAKLELPAEVTGPRTRAARRPIW